MAGRRRGLPGWIAPIMLLAWTASGAAADSDWTVATLARDGSWGVATDTTLSRAMAGANRACQAMAQETAIGPTDCGAQSAQARDGWIAARLCGDHRIIESAAARRDAEREARWSERGLRRTYVPDLPACRPVFTVEPGGNIIFTGPQYVGSP